MTKIILCRHGEVEGISPPRFRGRAELELTQHGTSQAETLAARIAKECTPAAIYSSPLQRCMQTGAAIARATGAALSALDDLIDIDYGSWQWKTHEQVRHETPEDFTRWFNVPWLMRFPSGESLQDLLARTADALRFLAARHQQDTVVLIGHEAVNRAMLLQVLDRPLTKYWAISQAPCTINEFDIAPSFIRVIRVDDSAHLRQLSAP
jgi:probable phosphoglycerate mutase